VNREWDDTSDDLRFKKREFQSSENEDERGMAR
jgi:hypothetical protein